MTEEKEISCPNCGLTMEFGDNWTHAIEMNPDGESISCEHTDDAEKADERRRLNEWAEKMPYQVDSRELREEIAKQIESECYYEGNNIEAMEICFSSIDHPGCHHKRDAAIARGQK